MADISQEVEHRLTKLETKVDDVVKDLDELKRDRKKILIAFGAVSTGALFSIVKTNIGF